MSSAALDLDLATLVGELEDVPCEHSQHGTGHYNHDNGTATFYVQAECWSCGYKTPVYGACARFSESILVGFPAHCVECLARGSSRDMIRILGPVNGRSS